MSLSPLDVSGVQTKPGSGRTLADLRDMEVCDVHGPYVVRQTIDGTVYAANPGGCPHCLSAKRAQGLLSASNIPTRFAHCDFDNYLTETDKQRLVLDACRAYAADFESNLAAGCGLILLGNPGTGKNHLATAICKAVRAAKRTVLRVKASEFLDAYWGKDFKEREAWMQELAAVHLLILDEVGRSSSTANAQNAFFRLIDARYEAVRPTMVLSNLDRQGVIDVMSEAAYDRLREAGACRLTFDWQSLRASVGVEQS